MLQNVWWKTNWFIIKYVIHKHPPTILTLPDFYQFVGYTDFIESCGCHFPPEINDDSLPWLLYKFFFYVDSPCVVLYTIELPLISFSMFQSSTYLLFTKVWLMIYTVVYSISVYTLHYSIMNNAFVLGMKQTAVNLYSIYSQLKVRVFNTAAEYSNAG